MEACKCEFQQLSPTLFYFFPQCWHLMNEIAPKASKYSNTLSFGNTPVPPISVPFLLISRGHSIQCLSLSSTDTHSLKQACFLLRRSEDQGAPELSAKIQKVSAEMTEAIQPEESFTFLLISVDTYSIKAQHLSITSKACFLFLLPFYVQGKNFPYI